MQGSPLRLGHPGGHEEQFRVSEADATEVAPLRVRGRPVFLSSKCRGAFLLAAHPAPAASYVRF